MTLRKKLIDRGLKREANDIRELLPGWSPTFLRKLGNFDVVIDVGVLDGTPVLYKAFPNAYLILCEAIPTYKESIDAILKNHPGRGEAYINAVTDLSGPLKFNVVVDDPRLSGPHDSLLFEKKIHEIVVDGITLDAIFNQSSHMLLNKNILLKIDTEGHELKVLRGAIQA